MSEAGGERPSTAMSMRSVYRHNPSVYDTSVMYKTELRTAEQMEGESAIRTFSWIRKYLNKNRQYEKTNLKFCRELR